MGKTTEGIKTGISIYGAIKNKRDHNQFQEEIAHAKRMAIFGNIEVSNTSVRVSSLNGNLNRAWHYIKQNFENLQRIFFFHNQLVKKHNELCKKVGEQQEQINKLKNKIENLKEVK